MKFICKEFWAEVFRKSVDNLRTNHRWGNLNCNASASRLLQGARAMTAAHQGRGASCLSGSLLWLRPHIFCAALPILPLCAVAPLCCETRSSDGSRGLAKIRCRRRWGRGMMPWCCIDLLLLAGRSVGSEHWQGAQSGCEELLGMQRGLPDTVRQ